MYDEKRLESYRKKIEKFIVILLSITLLIGLLITTSQVHMFFSILTLQLLTIQLILDIMSEGKEYMTLDFICNLLWIIYIMRDL